MVNGVILTHGRLGEELIRTGSLIAGEDCGLKAVSNEGMSPQGMAEALERELRAIDDGDGVILFVDLVGGSCEVASQAVARLRKTTRVICGVNLAMVLAFIQYRSRVPISELVKKVEERGRGSIRSD
jgi:PTS system mannose-specific IIA component